MENKELPLHLQEEINQKAKASIRLKNWGEGVQFESYVRGATAYATWKVKHDELKKENEQLRRWKMEAAELLMKINSYAHKHLEIKLGQCAVEFVIARAKERDILKERCEKIRLALVMTIFALKLSYNEEDQSADLRSELTSAIRIGEEALKEGERPAGGMPVINEPILNDEDINDWEEGKLTQERADFIREVNNRDLPPESNTPGIPKLKELTPEEQTVLNKTTARLFKEGNNIPAPVQGEKELVKIKPGLMFRNVHMPNHSFEIHSVDPANNKLAVNIRSANRLCWTEIDWNLEHTQWAFEKGEYYLPK